MRKQAFADRIIVLDTETTGLNPQEGHRIIEIGCVELIKRRLTGNRFQVYINPERPIDDAAVEVHGITNEFLADKPKFAAIADDFISFIKDAELVIHNAAFDVGFLNHEFSKLHKAPIESYSRIFDTLIFAREKHPGQRNSLDALCKRYGVDNSHRDLHGALLDAEILADVFLLMTGGQFSLLEEEQPEIQAVNTSAQFNAAPVNRPPLRVIPCSDEELEAHQARLKAIEKASGTTCLWQRE